MADLIDKAESDMSQMINRVGSQAVSRGGQAAVKLSINVARSVTNAPYAAAAAVWGAARRAVHEATDTGKVTLKTFSNLADGRREVITLDDQAVSRELEKELKRHGVTWAMEKQSDGSTTFHVQGADIELVQHALGVAAERVDERLVRRGGDRQEQPQQEQSAQEQAREHDGTEQEQSVAERDDQVLDLDEAERSALADELRKYADYREGDLDLDTRERAAELSNDPTYAYDEQATTEALEQEQEQIGQFQQEQIAAASPYRELADQVEQTGRLDLTDDAVRRDVTEVVENTGWRLDGDAQDAPPQPIQRVVEAVQAPRPQEQPQHDQVPQQAAPERDEYDEPVQADSVGAHGTDELPEDAPARSSADDATVEHNQPAATAERDEAVADRGGHSEQRDPAASRAEQAPQISARDQTRRRNADRIDKKVTEKKAELSADKARTKKRGPRRDTANEARPTRRG